MSVDCRLELMGRIPPPDYIAMSSDAGHITKEKYPSESLA